jgi:hypothetical protein
MKRSELNKVVFQYILDAIDGEGYDKVLNTDTEKLQFLAECFKIEYCFPDNLRRFGSYQNCMAEWFMGLPSSFNIDYENYRIIEIAKSWGSIPQDATDRQEDKVLDNWFNWIANKTIQLMKKHNVSIY